MEREDKNPELDEMMKKKLNLEDKEIKDDEKNSMERYTVRCTVRRTPTFNEGEVVLEIFCFVF